MSNPTDDQLPRILDTFVERLRVSISEQVRLAADQLSEAVGAERRAAVEAAARDSAAAAERDVTARLSASFANREEATSAAARAAGFDAGLQQGRAEARAAQEARDADMQAQIDVAVRAASDAAAGAEAARKSAAAARAEAAVSAASLATLNQSRLASAAQLLRSVRALDDTTSLSQTLDALAAAAKAEAERMVLFLVRGEGLHAWSHAGFDAVAGTPVFEIPMSQAGVAADAIRSVTSRHVAADKEGRPAFARERAAGAFAAVPITMNGQVIAVLCGEQPASTDEGGTLASALEILARHAARVLESLTAVRLAQLGAQPATASPSTALQ